MSYFYTIVYLTILSTSIFAMDRKEVDDRKNSDHSSYNPRREFYEQSKVPNKSVADIPDNSKYSSGKKQ